MKRSLSVLGLILFLGACGGPSSEAKIATLIQSMMANALSANLDAISGRVASPKGPFSCSVSGTLTFDTDITNVTPSLEGASGSTALIYNDCTFNVCGDSVTISGNQKSHLDLLVTAAQQITVTLTSTNEVFSGVLSGNQSFAYKMEASATTTAINAFTLKDAGNPLVSSGTTFSAADLNALADGC